ncbi:peptidoglycan DD-metalloendopeptidase family protein [Paenibacillus gansuensis]|uniref:Peptidoglycan DD-metalloendopeptidase family protein n=1 Tax=Paenibacillus gansuensis TaxID=306542 RepID=A0ABW5PFV1_9BACL
MCRIRSGKHKLTFLVIPEPERPVLQIRLSKRLLILLPLLTIGVLIYVYLSLHFTARRTEGQLQSKLTKQSRSFVETIRHKDEDIKRLQNEVKELSEKAEQVGRQVSRLQDLEAEINGFLGKDSTVDPNVTSGIGSEEPAAYSSMERSASGGLYYPQAAEDTGVSDTADAASEGYSTYSVQLGSLEQSLSDTLEEARRAKKELAVTPTFWPTRSIIVTSRFGYRSDPFTGRPSLHKGLDIAGDTGDPVYAAADGTVTLSDADGQHGQYLEVRHTGTLSTRYLHLSRRLAKTGDQVHKGELIGRLGSTGRSTGAHLHFEVVRRGKEVNPQKYLHSKGEDEAYVRQEED